MGEKKVTLKMLSERAGVSVATVSRVLNNESLVSDKLRQAVERAMKELDYNAKPKVRYVYKKRIGLLVRDIENEAYASMLKGMMDVARKHDAEILVYEYEGSGNSIDATLDVMLESKLDGLILSVTHRGLTTRQEQLIEEKFPVVFLVSSQELLTRKDTSIVTVNTYESVFLAIKYLADLGHRDILLISAEEKFEVERKSYLQVFQSMGLTPKESLLCKLPDSYSAAVQLVTERCRTRDFTAVFASTGLLTLGAWKALREQNLRLPEDISMVGFGDPRVAGALSITTLTEPWLEIGKNAVYNLLEQIHSGTSMPSHIVLQGNLVPRESCRRI